MKIQKSNWKFFYNFSIFFAASDAEFHLIRLNRYRKSKQKLLHNKKNYSLLQKFKRPADKVPEIQRHTKQSSLLPVGDTPYAPAKEPCSGVGCEAIDSAEVAVHVRSERWKVSGKGGKKEGARCTYPQGQLLFYTLLQKIKASLFRREFLKRKKSPDRTPTK